MDIHDIVSQAKDAISVKRVYGDPYERDGVVVIPAASVRGLGGGGSGEGSQADQGTGSGSGLGLGFKAHPVGAFVIRSGGAEWKAAVDTTSIALRVQGVLIVLLLILLRRSR
jgi:uncharacterized spore protein YtfJ